MDETRCQLCQHKDLCDILDDADMMFLPMPRKVQEARTRLGRPVGASELNVVESCLLGFSDSGTVPGPSGARVPDCEARPLK